MPKPSFTITEAVNLVAIRLQGGTDNSRTTIRCAINDQLDAADKAGYRVRFDYDQPRAVARVRSILEQHEARLVN